MNTDEFYAQLRTELAKRLQSDSRLTAIAEKIKLKKADFKDTAEYSQIVARHISKLIQEKIGTNSAVGIEFVCKELLKDHYSAINDVLGTVQAIVDEENNIHIAPQKAPFPQERVNKVAHALMDPRVPIRVIKRRAGAPVENVANSFHDDYIKENAKFRNDAGLKCYINRTTDGNCCDWCTKVAGRYVYGEHPDDVFRRHDNCGCLTTYENGRQRQSVWSKKSWSREEEREYLKELDAKKKAKRLSPKQARELQAKNLRKYHGLTADSRSGIIVAEDSPRKTGTGRFSVDWSIVQSPQYSAKFDHLSDNPKVARSVETRAKWALNNRTGTKTEELYAVSLLDGTEIFRIADQRIDSGVKRTADFTRKLYEAEQRGEKVLLIHNHPRGLPPSIGDINALLEHSNVSGITVGHDGSVYRYTRPKATIPQTEWDVAMRHFSGYSESTAMEKALELLSRKYQFEVEIL